MDPRRPPSDAASYSSSTGSIWSTTDSVSFVYTDNVDWAWWGDEGIRGAVTRKDDKRDERRIRFAAHFLRGPFAGHKSKKHSSSRRRDSDTQSNYSSNSGHSSSSRRQREFSRGPPPMPPPPSHAYAGPPPPPQHQHPQHFDNFSHVPPMGMRPPPPPMPGPPQQPGFEAGFIQIGGGGGGPPSHHNHDPWNNGPQYDGEPEVWD
ncbi:hypothetical protein F4803DRAFT_399904 [Xylaria telfairii]|nr:hypothetical protein F4803DRAFT_399904 [Xylaria telfairii]